MRNWTMLRIGAALAMAVGPAPVANAETAAGVDSEHGDEHVQDEDAHRLRWRYPRFRVWQYALVVTASGVNLYDGSFRERSDRADRWKGGILFDDAVRSALRADDADTRRNANTASDWLWHPPEFYPLVVDVLFVPLVLDDFNTDVSWQLGMLYLQSISLASLTLRAIRYPVGRARPSDLERCEAAPSTCRLRSLSFPSGHAQMVAAGAGVGCANHLALPLYGGGWPDVAACGVLGAAAVANGAFRLVADEHWATDVLTGWLLGGAIGFGLPWLLHYRSPDEAAPSAWTDLFVLPMTGDGDLGLLLFGRL